MTKKRLEGTKKIRILFFSWREKTGRRKEKREKVTQAVRPSGEDVVLLPDFAASDIRYGVGNVTLLRRTWRSTLCYLHRWIYLVLLTLYNHSRPRRYLDGMIHLSLSLMIWLDSEEKNFCPCFFLLVVSVRHIWFWLCLCIFWTDWYCCLFYS